jgi:glyoxylase-like metal-dependent hydrolase (beta-lactamase superfamily II)
MINYKTYNLIAMYETNTYLVWDTVSKEAILIDPAAPSESLKNDILQMNLKLTHIFNTHGHGDHIGGNDYFHKEFGCPIGIHDSDAGMLICATLNLSEYMACPFISPAATLLINDHHYFTLGEVSAKVIHTPGHTRGGIVIYIEPYLFSGDTIFQLSVGRTDLPGGNTKDLVKSIRKEIFTLPDNTIILPGHGPTSTVAKEKAENPYV